MTDYRVTFLQKETCALVTHPFEPTPAPGELVGENVISSISTGSERGGFTQQFPDDAYPMETGSSSIARVIAVGEGVTGWNVGDLFFHLEHHTRYVKVPMKDAIRIPEGAKPEHLIFGRYSAVSMTSISLMKAKAPDRIIVSGLGLVGLMCAAVLQCYGYTVYAVDLSEEQQDTARAFGIQRVGSTLEALNVAAQSCGALIECSGNEKALRGTIPYLRKYAEAFQVGVPWRKTSDWDAHTLLRDVFYSYVSIHSGFEWGISRRGEEGQFHSSYGHIQMAMDLIAEGKITIPESMYELRDPADCHEVYSEIAQYRMGATSIILDWRMLK